MTRQIMREGLKVPSKVPRKVTRKGLLKRIGPDKGGHWEVVK